MSEPADYYDLSRIRPEVLDVLAPSEPDKLSLPNDHE